MESGNVLNFERDVGYMGVCICPNSSNHICYGMNVCVPPKLICWNSNPYGDALRGGTFGRSWEWHLHEWDLCPYQRDSRELLSSFHGVRIQCEVCLEAKKRLLPGPDHAGPLILDFEPPELWKTSFCCYKPLNLWHSI